VREADPQAYVELETALDQIKDAVMVQPLDLAKVKAAYAHLKERDLQGCETLRRRGEGAAHPNYLDTIANHSSSTIAFREDVIAEDIP
jgi:hypothetical protein